MNQTLNNNKKKFACDRCEFSCDYKSRFDRHIKQVHDKIRDFVCNIDGCESAFSDKSNLNMHIKTVHNKIRDFFCDVGNCEKAFFSKSDLKKHKSYIHDIGVKWYYCPEEKCDYKSKDNSTLKRHQKQCMGEGIGSNGEKYVKQCLSDLGFLLDEDYVFNQSFQPLSDYADKNLRPDFRFLYHNIIIEYDGIQHFSPRAFGKMSQEKAEERFKETQENDKIKDDFCRENGFKMIRIPYTKFAETLANLSVELHDIVDWYG